MRDEGLKVNDPKYIVVLKDMTYICYIITREGIIPDTKKLQGIMDIGQPTTMTEVRTLIGMVQYYRDMWPRRSDILDPLTEASIGPQGRKIIWSDALKDSVREPKHMVSAENLLSYPYRTITFTVHTNATDKQLGAVIIKNNKPIALFSIILSKPQHNYTTTNKELLAIVERIHKFCGILFGY